jgi:hypothetical protein
MLVRMRQTFFEDGKWLYAGQEYDLPDDIAKDFTGSAMADAINGPVFNKSLGGVKENKNGSTKIGKRPRGRPRKSK